MKKFEICFYDKGAREMKHTILEANTVKSAFKDFNKRFNSLMRIISISEISMQEVLNFPAVGTLAGGHPFPKPKKPIIIRR